MSGSIKLFGRLCAYTVFVATAVLVGGCGGNPVRDRIESAVEQKLPELIGPARAYKVSAHGPVLGMVKGRLDRLDITGEDVKLAAGVTVSRLKVSIDGLEFDRDTNAIRRAGATRYSAVLNEAEVNRWVLDKYPDIPELKVALREGTARVSARPGLSKAKVTITADARPVIHGGRQLGLDLLDVRAVGVSTPGFAREYLERKLPAIFDVRDLGFDATVDAVEVSPGELTLRGSLDLLAALQSARGCFGAVDNLLLQSQSRQRLPI